MSTDYKIEIEFLRKTSETFKENPQTMSVYNIKIVHGVVVEFIDVLKFFASIGKLQQIIDRTNEFISRKEIHRTAEIVSLNTMEIMALLATWIKSDKDYQLRVYENFIDNSFSENFVHTWECCSKLKMNKFVIGQAIQLPLSGSLAHCFNEIYSMDNLEINTASWDEEIMKRLGPLGITKEQIKTIIIPIGCIHCT